LGRKLSLASGYWEIYVDRFTKDGKAYKKNLRMGEMTLG
jgi:hypothetical protein